ncbi:protein of unknown function [Cupriavidus taiwanensis]|nr:protein of unknown function [Cupriavidus taiwanensis]
MLVRDARWLGALPAWVQSGVRRRGRSPDGPGAQRPGQPPRVPRAGVNHKIQDLVMRGDFGFQTHDRRVCDYSNPGTVHWRSLALSHPRQSP